MSRSSVYQNHADDISDESGSRLVRPFVVKRVPQQSQRRSAGQTALTYWQPPTKESAPERAERYRQFLMGVAAGMAAGRGEQNA